MKKKYNILKSGLFGAIIGLTLGLIENIGIISGIIPRHLIGGIFLYITGRSLFIMLFMHTLVLIIIGFMIGIIIGLIIIFLKQKH
jgi:hypothetical protein